MPRPTLRSDSRRAAADTLRPGSTLALAGVRPRKSRGQNFLVQERLAQRIVSAAQLAPGDVVVEIGPGLGILSGVIGRHPITRLALIEIDSRLAALLAARFAADPRVSVIDQDFLRADFNRITADGLVKVIGNLPFNAAAAAIAGLTRCVRPPLPCRPSKLRLLVDAQRSPGCRRSAFIATHIEQPGSRHSKPAALKTVFSPSRSACSDQARSRYDER